MTLFKVLILFSFFALSVSYCNAQGSNKYVYQDSSEKRDESVTAVSPASALGDTALYYNNLQLSPDSVAALKNSKSFAYAKNLDSLLKDRMNKSREEMTDEEKKLGWLASILVSPVTKLIMWTLATLFILFVLYKLLFVEGVFRKTITRSKVNELQDDETHPTQQDYEKLILRAVSVNDYRLAIRYLYLQSLQRLTFFGLVHPEADKTNFQYINELNGTKYKEEFSWLTLNYEYIWYGAFDVNLSAFTQLQNRFIQFNSRLEKN